MNETNIAAQIKAAALEEGNDELFLLEVIRQVKNADLNKVIAEYKKLNSGLLTLVRITTTLELSKDQKSKIESKLTQKLASQKLAFAYIINPDFGTAIEIRVGDDLIEFSFT